MSVKENSDIKIMTPGPTQVAENVYHARSLRTTNPDLDPQFYDFYRDTCRLFGKLIHTENPCFILGGEGILGLEAACASLTEPGDRVLVIDNGIFGKGFADFVSVYQGEPVVWSLDYHNPLTKEKLRNYLEKDHDFKYATIVHSDTPTGLLNPVEQLCPVLKEYGILTVADSVTGMFADELNVDEAQIDIVCGGSQKALSAPPGLTMVAVSREAFQAMHDRKTPIRSFYANLLTFETYYEDQWFPYTMPVSDIMGLRQALENVAADTQQLARHGKIASAARKALTDAGLTLYLESGFASSVTVFYVPEGMKAQEILDTMVKKHHIMIAGCFDILAGKVLRIGHMGNNANIADMTETLSALADTLKELGFVLKADPAERFLAYVE
ncbi:MAG: alanine--glyoxylate aminotransferase family protein [Lachnospiraceae bacterium]|nr:alanine--glyoxylate aminotransferase family protein [Lachnospiraceae bacterium]